MIRVIISNPEIVLRSTANRITLIKKGMPRILMTSIRVIYNVPPELIGEGLLNEDFTQILNEDNTPIIAQ